MLEYDETLKLLQKAKLGDQNAKNKIIEENSPLVKSIVRRYRNKGVEYEDLYQLGCVGMTKAINNFDEKFGVKFSTYAVPMIAGEIKRFLRDDGSIKVSRSIKAQYYAIQKFIDEYKKSNDNTSPSTKQISEKFDIDESELMFILESSKMPLSIYEQVDKEQTGSGSALLLDRIANTNEQDDMINHMALKDIIRGLNKKDRLLIILRYYRDKTQSEIASIMNVSQVQVSRLETRVLNKLKTKLRD